MDEQMKANMHGMLASFRPEEAVGVDATVQFNFTGPDAGQYWLKIADGAAQGGQGLAEIPTIKINVTTKDWADIVSGKLGGAAAFMTGKLKVEGDIALLMKFQKMFRQ